MLDNLLFVVFSLGGGSPRVTGGTVYRYLTNQFSFTSLSSQFLESDVQFWGSTLWHYRHPSNPGKPPGRLFYPSESDAYHTQHAGNAVPR